MVCYRHVCKKYSRHELGRNKQFIELVYQINMHVYSYNFTTTLSHIA